MSASPSSDRPPRPRLDVDELRSRASTASGRDVHRPHELPGGASSLTFLAHWTENGDDPLVLKVAPPGVAPVRNRDVLRQARILRALAGTPAIPVPRVLFEDSGNPPESPPLFGMSFVPGESLEPHIDPDVVLPSAADITGRARDAAEALAALHRVTPSAVGLGDEPAGTLADEVDRWARLFATAPPELSEGADHVAERLAASVPAALPATLLHGDYRLGNTLCEAGSLRAVIDWEIWSVGDPRIDVAWFLLTADPSAHPSAVRKAPGMPGPDALLEAYRDAGGPGTTGLDWFRALVLYKLAAASALIAKNAARRGDPGGFGARAARQLPDMIARARAAIG
ncbi:phosphotransferase family protein [Yinghuangia sp. ASG 101]|uniref:phosphotransferase family protein n=1 Tax=Yinghuangia sp. ASG 101 TaxID=2896848 RepID=UPI001E497738|nr:phosphotransferase family protein [Yinghuangia sp. ASG 101]UGQ11197.1 phosphotransferase family protein [Yinghuangia sp. ASG 101]